MYRGTFAVLKPVGITSAEATNRIKAVIVDGVRENYPATTRNQRQVKVGHGGTLDKRASGVLVVGIGDDCRKLTAFLKSEKWYECVGKLGEATDSRDGDGKVVEKVPWEHIKESDISKALIDNFTGEVCQIPPAYSAIKCGGKRSSDLARRGVVFTPPSRKITVYDIKLMKFQPPFFKIYVHCSSGTYIRSIVHDLGHCLKSAAHVTELCRTRQGAYSLDTALPRHNWTFENIRRFIQNTSKFNP